MQPHPKAPRPQSSGPYKSPSGQVTLAEAGRLRQQVARFKAEIADLQDELQEKNNMYLAVVKERHAGFEQINNAKESLGRYESLVKEQVDRAMAKERKEHEQIKAERDNFQKQIQALLTEKSETQKKIRELQDEIQKRDGDDRTMQSIPKDSQSAYMKATVEKKDKEILSLKKQIDELQNHLEDFMAENKFLREKWGIPDNYGNARDQVKLLDREKIDDFKKLIRVLQEDNYHLEAERAKWKHRVKQLSMQRNTGPDSRYSWLNEQQLQKVDEFVHKLENNEVADPVDVYEIRKENQELKAKIDVLFSEKAQTVFEQLKDQVQQKGNVSNADLQLQTRAIGELRDKLDFLINHQSNMAANNKESLGGQSPHGDVPSTGRQARGFSPRTYGFSHMPSFHNTGGIGSNVFHPPEPRVNPDNSITHGYSYKFDMNLPVTGRNGEEKGVDARDMYDNAFLQLQIMECFVDLKKKDDLLKLQQREIDNLESKVKRYLLMQDHLYKDYVKMEKAHAKDVEDLKTKAKESEDELRQEKTKTKELEKVIEKVNQPGSTDEIKGRLIELTKQNSLLEVNLIRMTRKYQSLEEQEKLLRRSYQSMEIEMGDMETECLQRINHLVEWKKSATFQLKQLYQQLRVAVPQFEYDKLSKELEIFKQKNGDLCQRNRGYAEKISSLQREMRELKDSALAQRELKEEKDDLEREFNMLRQRLELKDPMYRRENQLYNSIVAKLRRHRISVIQAFENFDSNSDGYLNRGEFEEALIKLGLDDLNRADLDLVLRGIDLNQDGRIQYREFERKLQRYGLKPLSAVESIAYEILKKLRPKKLNVHDLFRMINKDGEGLATRKDLRDILETLALKVSKEDADRFIDYFFPDRSTGVDHSTFIRIFEGFERSIQREENPNAELDKRKRARVPIHLLEKKKKVFNELDSALRRAGATLGNLFKQVDTDGTNRIEFNEFYTMFQKMSLQVSQSECQQIFTTIDADQSGQIQWTEFKHDFDKCKSMTLKELEDEEKLLHGDFHTEFADDPTGGYSGSAGGGFDHIKELEYQRRIATLQDKVKQGQVDLKNEISMLRLSEQQVQQLQQRNEDLRKQVEVTREEHFKQQKEIQTMQVTISQSIRKNEAEEIERTNRQLQSQLTEVRAALSSYKKMHTVVGEQVKSLKMMHERRKDENESLVQTLRDLQAEEMDKRKYEKLHYIVMLSRWQEAAVNKKYQLKMNECNELKGELLNFQQMLENKEHEHDDAETEIRKTKQVMQNLKQELQSCKNLFLTIEQGLEFDRVISQLTDERSTLEERYLKVRSECVSALNMLDDARVRAEETDRLLKDLRFSKPGELSSKLMEMSEQMQQRKLSALKAERKVSELDERESYLSNLLRNKDGEITRLEQQLSTLEKDMHQKEERWRLQDNERMRKFFNKQYEHGDDAAGILPSRNVSQPFARPRTSGEQVSSFERRVVKEADTTELRMMQNEISKLKEENRHLQSMNRQFQNWQETDSMIMVGDGSISKDAWEEQRLKLQNVQAEESKQMAEAAHQTIKTLNEMLSHKNQQLRTKESEIDKLRQQMSDQRESFLEKQMKLQSELTTQARSGLNNLHNFVNTNRVDDRPGVDPGAIEAQRKAETELRKAQSQLEYLQKMLNEAQDKVESLRSDLHAEKEASQTLKAHYDEQVKKLEGDVRRETQKREKAAKSRVQKNDQIIDKFHKEMLEYEKKIQELTDANNVMKLKVAHEKPKASKVPEVVVAGSASEKKLADLQELVKKRDQELVKLREKEIKKDKEAKDQKEKYTDLEKKLKLEQEKVGKYIKEKDDAQAAMRAARKEAETERFHKDRHKEDLNRLLQERQGSSGVASTKIQLHDESKNLVVFSSKLGTFEYVGEPVALAKEELTSVPTIVEAIKAWLSKPFNERLSPRAIFESQDLETYSEMNEETFESSLNLLGIKLRSSELRVLRGALDKKFSGMLNYASLLKELEGIPQLDLMDPAIASMGRTVESLDMTRQKLLMLVDPSNLQSLQLEDLKTSLSKAKIAGQDFKLEEAQVKTLFTYLTSGDAPYKNKIATQDLVNRVQKAVHAILIEKMSASFTKAHLSVNDMYDKYDANKDSFLESGELLKAVKDSGLTLQPNMQSILTSELLDPRGSKGSFGGGPKIGKKLMAKYFGRIAGGSAAPMMAAASSVGVPVSRAEPGNQIPSGSIASFSATDLKNLKKAARKILNACPNNLVDMVGKLDHLEEGIVSREEVKVAIEQHKVSGLERDELALFMKFCDKGYKGYLSSNKFVDKVNSLSAESEAEVLLRRLARNVSHAQISLKREMQNHDTSGRDILSKEQFKKCLKQLGVSLSDSEIACIHKEFSNENGTVAIKQFCADVIESGKPKNYLSGSGKGGQDFGGRGRGGGNSMAAFEAEKRYKKNLGALKEEIEEKNREIQGLRKDIKDCNDRATRLEDDKRKLEARLVDKHSKPPKETHHESLAFSQGQELMQLKDQLFYQQDENTKLRKTIEVNFKAELSRLSIEKEQVEERLRDTQDEKSRLQQQINRLIGKPMDGVEKREELELYRQMKIGELEAELEKTEKGKSDLQDQLFKAEEKLLDMKFEKETYDLQYARLQKRVSELEQYKHTSAKLSAHLKHQQAADMHEIDEIAGKSATEGKKKKEGVRLRAQGSKSVSELEMLVESLKRAIEKLRTENEVLKKENAKTAGQSGKVSSEKALRQKISNLEQLVHSYEMKEINLDERERTIKKLIEANKQLREDFSREIDRYTILEAKYKEVLYHYTTVAKENQKNEELVFGMTTGGSMARFEEFLGDRK